MLYQAVRTEVNKTLSCGLMLTWIKTGLCLILLLSINIKGFQFLCVCFLSIIRSLVLSYLLTFSSVQFSSVAQSCLTLCDPMNHSTPGLPVHHQLLTLGLLKYPTLNRICVLQNFQLYCAKSLQSRLTLCDPMDCSPPGSCAHGTFQARILEWVDMLSSRGASQPRDQTQASYVSFIGSCVLYH